MSSKHCKSYKKYLRYTDDRLHCLLQRHLKDIEDIRNTLSFYNSLGYDKPHYNGAGQLEILQKCVSDIRQVLSSRKKIIDNGKYYSS